MKNPWIIVVLVWVLAIGWALGSPALFMMAHTWLSGVYRWAGMEEGGANGIACVMMIALYFATTVLGGVVAAAVSGEVMEDD